MADLTPEHVELLKALAEQAIQKRTEMGLLIVEQRRYDSFLRDACSPEAILAMVAEIERNRILLASYRKEEDRRLVEMCKCVQCKAPTEEADAYCAKCAPLPPAPEAT